jgi:phage baseplate assembly protein gpV
VNGVTRGIVRGVDAARARLLAEFPWMGPGELGRWAPVAGTYFMPEPGDEVLVAFDQGRLDHPYVIGCLWSNADQPPANDQPAAQATRLLPASSFRSISDLKR